VTLIALSTFSRKDNKGFHCRFPLPLAAMWGCPNASRVENPFFLWVKGQGVGAQKGIAGKVRETSLAELWPRAYYSYLQSSRMPGQSSHKTTPKQSVRKLWCKLRGELEDLKGCRLPVHYREHTQLLM